MKCIKWFGEEFRVRKRGRDKRDLGKRKRWKRVRESEMFYSLITTPDWIVKLVSSLVYTLANQPPPPPNLVDLEYPVFSNINIQFRCR